MTDEQERVLSTLVEEIDELAQSASIDTSKPELLDCIEKMMWKVTWAIEDIGVQQ